MKRNWMRRIWYTAYNNGGDGGNAGGGTGGDGGNAGGGTGGDGGNAGGTGGGGTDDDKPTISQKKLGQILADERKKSQKQTQDLVKQLEELKSSSQLTAQQKTELETRIEELNSSLLTKEQLAQKEREKLVTESKKQQDALTSERDVWKSRYTEAIISREITDAAVTGEVFSPAQIVSLLQPSARLVEEVDGEGKPKGTFATKIKFKGKDKDGKPVILDLSPEEAIKAMKETPDQYGNLFKSNVSGGIGGHNGNNNDNGNADYSKMSTDEYRKRRQKMGLGKQT